MAIIRETITEAITTGIITVITIEVDLIHKKIPASTVVKSVICPEIAISQERNSTATINSTNQIIVDLWKGPILQTLTLIIQSIILS